MRVYLKIRLSVSKDRKFNIFNNQFFLITRAMKKPRYPYRIAILMFLLTVPPIGATQLGWYLHDMQTGFDYGMIVGTVTVIYAAWLMYEKKWREEDED